MDNRAMLCPAMRGEDAWEGPDCVQAGQHATSADSLLCEGKTGPALRA